MIPQSPTKSRFGGALGPLGKRLLVSMVTWWPSCARKGFQLAGSYEASHDQKPPKKKIQAGPWQQKNHRYSVFWHIVWCWFRRGLNLIESSSSRCDLPLSGVQHAHADGSSPGHKCRHRGGEEGAGPARVSGIERERIFRLVPFLSPLVGRFGSPKLDREKLVPLFQPLHWRT